VALTTQLVRHLFEGEGGENWLAASDERQETHTLHSAEVARKMAANMWCRSAWDEPQEWRRLCLALVARNVAANMVCRSLGAVHADKLAAEQNAAKNFEVKKNRNE
jgi:hypothetical protein